MPIAASDVKWIEEPRIGILEQLYLPAILQGLTTTVKHIFSPKMTVLKIARPKVNAATVTLM